MCKTYGNFDCLRYVDFVFSLNDFLKFLIGYNLFNIISTHDKTKYLHIVLTLFALSYYCYSINFALILLYSIITYLVLQNKYIPVYNCCKPLIYVGKYSFVWYLVHQNIGYIILIQFTGWRR